MSGSFSFWCEIAPNFMQGSLKGRTDKGKPREIGGRKATGLKNSDNSICFKAAGLPKIAALALRDKCNVSPQAVNKQGRVY